MGITQLWTGALSDRVGRKRLIVGGMVVQGAALFAMVLVEGFAMWLVTGAMLGIGTAMVYPTLLAAIGDVAHPSWRGSALGIYRRGFGYVAGALVAGILADGLVCAPQSEWSGADPRVRCAGRREDAGDDLPRGIALIAAALTAAGYSTRVSGGRCAFNSTFYFSSMMMTGSLSSSTVRSVLTVVSFLYSLSKTPSESRLISVFTSVFSVTFLGSGIVTSPVRVMDFHSGRRSGRNPTHLCGPESATRHPMM